ncbi:putative non-muscle myosin heavy chain [Neospora caninum Liverpool]|uniref:Non-muscle myosin heavy chain, putative n=1 Tax=Neospora caninum (strain Liverpool) TaxID=572307 RepID=F0VMV7_NEOCL|nr:putative non-muscle myosin heavy chain [Neospora caninum Liverpool]CBZ55053.1 putative non-muscle myosin heavy chain [Neospora caninum Liverpool]CEL69777.1 TPA: non-muscle myosin heavy chain, putative [Neospora caninum Liverpool]|eukprot:XP_003885081.1 putative non-muscle myosin heavy chain [Neospora caninum Liverpool]
MEAESASLTSAARRDVHASTALGESTNKSGYPSRVVSFSAGSTTKNGGASSEDGERSGCVGSPREASSGPLAEVLEKAKTGARRILQRLCTCQEEVDKASICAARLLSDEPADAQSVFEDGEKETSVGQPGKWEQQALLHEALQRQIDGLRGYAEALEQLSSSLTATVARATGVFASVRKGAQAEDSQILALGAIVAATCAASSIDESDLSDNAGQLAGCSFVQLLETLTDCEDETARALGAASSKTRTDAAAVALEDRFQSLKERLEDIEAHAERRADFVIRWTGLFVDGAAEVEKSLGEAAPLVARGIAWEKHIDAQLETGQKEKRALELRLNKAGRDADQVASRLNEKRQQFLLAIEDWTTERLDQLTKEERTQRLTLRIDALERQVRGLAAFSPLFIVERTPKYVTLQYKPLGSKTDYEISIEGLELSLDAQEPHAYKISSFFSVRVTPQLVWLEERLQAAIRDYFSTACTLAHSESLRSAAHAEAGQGGFFSGLEFGGEARGDSGDARLRTVYEFSPYNVAQQELLNCAKSGFSRKRTREEGERGRGAETGTGHGWSDRAGGRRRLRGGEERKTHQVKIFAEHIAAIVLKTLTTAFAARRAGESPRKYPPYNFVKNACRRRSLEDRTELVTSA